VGSSILVTGYAIDGAASSGTGIDAVYIYAYPGGLASGNKPIGLGGATYGLFNAEAAAIAARFANSGYNRTVGLSGGVYDLVVFARKISDLKWISRVVRITVN
jgi:hypothetical protein